MTFGIIGFNTITSIVIPLVKNQFPDACITLVDDDPLKLFNNIDDVRVEMNFDDWLKLSKSPGEFFSIICLGENNLKKRKELYLRSIDQSVISFKSLIDSSAIISNKSIIMSGNIISYGVIIAHNTIIYENSVFWSGVVVEHDCIIGHSCYLGPNVTLSGFVSIGECSLIGSGAVILPEIEIGMGCLIGAGSVVTKNIPSNSVVMGSPARIIRKWN